MATKKKLIELDEKALAILEKQAKIEKRSLKNYLEYVLEDKAQYFSEPSEEYKAMMDHMIDRHEKGELNWTSHEDLMKKYGR